MPVRRALHPSPAALAAALLLLIGPGCSAMAKYDRDARPAPFSATCNSLGAIYVVARGYEPVRGRSCDVIVSRPTLPFWLLDLPIALAADVLTLPLDLARYRSSEVIENHRQRWSVFAEAVRPKPRAASQEDAPAARRRASLRASNGPNRPRARRVERRDDRRAGWWKDAGGRSLRP